MKYVLWGAGILGAMVLAMFTEEDKTKKGGKEFFFGGDKKSDDYWEGFEDGKNY